jgi:quercetin dioxygenase-like cupin family protein
MNRILVSLISFAVICGVAEAQESKAQEHILMAPTDAQWGAPPPVFEKGMSFAVVSGDPSKPGLYVVRAKMPAGYKIAPHWHPTDEHVTVLAGTMAVGMGEKFDETTMKALPVGGYALLPADMRHFAMAKTAATIQIHGQGPFMLTYVNPADDPSKRTPAK